MSLATTSGIGGGGAGGGGLILAHQANNVGQGAAPPPPPDAAAVSGGHGGPIFFGADLSDKNQSLSLKQVKNVSHLPLVGIDLHASEPHVAYFPPKPDDPSQGATPVLVGKMKGSVYLKANELSHKTLKKYLALSKSYRVMQHDCLTKASDAEAVVLHKPQLFLGLRRIADAPEFIRQQVEQTDSSPDKSHAIAEEIQQGVGAVLTNSTLDGSESKGDDFDRVVWKVRLCDSKKAFPVLPEEAVQTLLHQAQYHVATKLNTDLEDPEIIDYPCAIALPAWSFHDAAIEALLEASDSIVVYHRSLCALAGALLPPLPDGGKASALLTRIFTVRQASKKEFQKTLAQNPDAMWDEDVTLVLVGMTEEGLEATAVQISSENGANACAIFGEYKVISNVSYQNDDPITLLNRCVTELEIQVGRIAPEADGPSGIVFYGSHKEQEQLKTEWEKHKSCLKEWTKVPLFTTKADAISLGTAVLGAVSHGRSTRIRSIGNKSRPELGLQVSNVAPIAVGVRIHYNGDLTRNKWADVPVKTIFDFDRRVPAGPFAIDLNAAECAVHWEHGANKFSGEELIKATKDNEGIKGIPKREKAALNLRVQIIQQWTRDGEWKQVGDTMKPLIKTTDASDDKASKEEACESVVLELSLGVTGMITSSLIGDRQSVVQATKTAYRSAMRYYIGIGLAILIFGGLGVRSYYEEYAFNRDVKRLLAFYRHVVPGSIADGDQNNARYLVWKYRSKKDRLWKMLEKKYGEPVLYPQDYEKNSDESGGKKGSHQEETVDLDEENVDSDREGDADEL